MDYIGFPFFLAKHKEDLSDESAANIIHKLPKRVTPLLITCLGSTDDTQALCKYLVISFVQLHDKQTAQCFHNFANYSHSSRS